LPTNTSEEEACAERFETKMAGHRNKKGDIISILRDNIMEIE
jgi:hypothetical protein